MASWTGNWIARNTHIIKGECNRLNIAGFSGFKKNPNIAGFIGWDTSEHELGAAAIGYISGNNPSILTDHHSSFAKLDTFGDPTVYQYDELVDSFGASNALMSAGSLFYAKIYSDLEVLTSGLTGLSVTEIGTGYGGLAAASADINEASWTCIHLPEINLLVSGYNAALPTTPKPIMRDTNNIDIATTPSMCVSLFHYSELDSEGRLWYRHNVMSGCDYVYLLSNADESTNNTIMTELSGILDVVTMEDETVGQSIGLSNKIITANKLLTAPDEVTGANLEGWWQADDLSELWTDTGRTTQVTTDGNAVGAWDDRSGNGRHLIAASASNTGNYRASEVNSLPTIEGDGVNTWMTTAAFTAEAQPYHVFLAIKLDDIIGAQRIISGNGTTPLLQANGGSAWQIFLGSAFVAGGTPDTNSHLVEIIGNGASSELIVDGVVVATGNPGTNNITSMAAFANVTGSVKGHVHIASLCFFDAEITGDELAGLRNYMNGKIGI